MRVAVTGASGQLGTSILRRLAADPTIHEILAVDQAPLAVANPKVRFHRGDVRDPAIGRLFEGCEAVFHLAFVVLGYLPRREFDAINVGGSRNVFEAAAKAGVKYLLYTSSIAAYGVLPGHPDPIDEQTPRRHQPGFPYAAAKHEVEQFLDAFEASHPDVIVTRLRPAIVIGPGSKGPSERSMRRRVWVQASEHGMPLVWEDDVAQAASLAFAKRARGAFVLAADEPMRGDRLAAAAGWRHTSIPPAVRLAAGRSMERLAWLRPPSIDPSWLIHLDVKMRLSSRKAREELGWRPDCPTCADVLRKYAATVPTNADRTLRLFVSLADRAAAPTAHRGARVHLALPGPDGGDIAVVAEGGRLRCAPGVPRPPTSVVTASASAFRAQISGRAGFEQLADEAQIEGDATGAAVVRELLEGFHEQARRHDPLGLASRLLTGWAARPAG